MVNLNLLVTLNNHSKTLPLIQHGTGVTLVLNVMALAKLRENVTRMAVGIFHLGVCVSVLKMDILLLNIIYLHKLR